MIGSLVPFHDVDMDSALGGTITSYGVTSKVETGTSGIIEVSTATDINTHVVYTWELVNIMTIAMLPVYIIQRFFFTGFQFRRFRESYCVQQPRESCKPCVTY